MKTNNAQGRTVCIAITAYLVAKFFLNIFIGGGLKIGDLLMALAMGFFMLTGLEYVNYVVAGLLVLGFLSYLPTNILHITNNWFFLLEGFVDVGCAVLLMILPSVKGHFTNKWAEFSEIFKG